MDEQTITAYLERIGAHRADPDAAALAQLSSRHLATVPFENLSIHLGEPVVLTPEALADKIVRRRRGGFCYELNGLFAELLTALGYDVTLLSARTISPRGTLGVPYDHLALRVDLAEPWLVDVGFGRHSEYPLRLTCRDEQSDPDGVFLLRQADYGDVDVIRDNVPTYRLEERPRALDDFLATCWYHQTSPNSSFTRNVTCSLPRPGGGRVTLTGLRLITTTAGQSRTEQELTPDEALAAYRDIFGFTLDRLPTLPAPAR